MVPPRRANVEQGEQRRTRSPPPPDFQLPWNFRNPDHALRYSDLILRPLGDTRYINLEALVRLGLSDHVFDYLNRIGWHDMAHLWLPTFAEITYEFLSSLEYNVRTQDPTDVGCIRFQLMGRPRRLTLAEFGTMFGFHTDGHRRRPREFVAEDFWHEIAVGDDIAYDAGRLKAVDIRDPALRYIHKLMTHTVFGRHASNSRVTTDELFFMWCILRRERVNTSIWLLKHFSHHGGDIRGPIVGAGLITQIAMEYGFECPHPTMHPAIPSLEIDLVMCRLGKLCRRARDGSYYLTGPRGEPIQPPAPLEDPHFGGLPVDDEAAPDGEPMPDPAPQPAPQPPFTPEASSSRAPPPQSSVFPPTTYQQLHDYMERRIALVVQQFRREHEQTRQTIISEIRAEFAAQIAALQRPRSPSPPPSPPASDV